MGKRENDGKRGQSSKFEFTAQVRDFIDRKDFPYWLKEIENTALFNDEDDEVVTERLKEMEGPMLCLL